jgi:hypothetical protein
LKTAPHEIFSGFLFLPAVSAVYSEGFFSSGKECVMFIYFSERKNPWFKKGLRAALAMVMAALVFTGCPQPTDSDGVSVPEALKGTWVSESFPDEVYRITDTEFISLWQEAESYKGDIVNIISDGEAAGYIIIKYTLNDFTPEAVGKYYAIRYKNLTASTVDILGSSDGAGKETQADAETEYPVANGYFDDSYYSTCANSGT